MAGGGLMATDSRGEEMSTFLTVVTGLLVAYWLYLSWRIYLDIRAMETRGMYDGDETK